MQRLNRNMLHATGAQATPPVPRPERVLQFGEGGFLRAFVDQMIDAANAQGVLDTAIIVVQPIAKGLCAELDAQNGLYTLMLRGKENGNTVRDVRVITAISRTVNPYADQQAFLQCAHIPELRFIVSNTTEAGIVYTGQDAYADAPQASFPGKLTRFLHERFLRFGQEPGKGFVLLPCELIDRNGDALRDAVLRTASQWTLGDAFIDWIERENIFTNTLVDRIVTGYPKGEADEILAELGYQDALLDVAEPFGLWVIEGPRTLAAELPLDQAGQHVIFTDDVTPYKVRKVRMLNGAHTSMILGAYLAGFDTVGECMADPVMRAFMTRTLYEEILPTLDLPRQELEDFAAAIFERFENPFNKHYLLSIALNSVSKFRARVLPTLQEYVCRKRTLPPMLTFSLAALIAFYRGEWMDGELELEFKGRRGQELYPIVDDAEVLAFFAAQASAEDALLARAVLDNPAFWGESLLDIDGLEAAVAGYLTDIRTQGAAATIASLIG